MFCRKLRPIKQKRLREDAYLKPSLMMNHSLGFMLALKQWVLYYTGEKASLLTCSNSFCDISRIIQIMNNFIKFRACWGTCPQRSKIVTSGGVKKRISVEGCPQGSKIVASGGVKRRISVEGCPKGSKILELGMIDMR